MIRPATLSDRSAIFKMLIAEVNRYPLKPDFERIEKGLIEAVSSSRHFAWVSERSGEVEGVLIGLTGANLWAARSNCQVVAWISKVPSDGANLLRAFRDWVRGRRDIKVAGMCPDIDGIDPRVWRLAERIGFKRHGGAYLLYN